MKSTTRVTAATAAQIRAAMFGTEIEGMQVVRQAWRTSDTDSDEAVLVNAHGAWWVARRMSDRLDVWAYAGDVEADEGFDLLLQDDLASGRAWHEVGEPSGAVESVGV